MDSWTLHLISTDARPANCCLDSPLASLRSQVAITAKAVDEALGPATPETMRPSGVNLRLILEDVRSRAALTLPNIRPDTGPYISPLPISPLACSAR